MAFTAQDVKNLREQTGVGMMDCKKALTEADGNFEKAIEILREKGLAAATKKAGRIAAEGAVYATVCAECGVGAIVEINSETDFVAKNDQFKDLCAGVATVVMTDAPADVEALKECKFAGSEMTVIEMLREKILTIGEAYCPEGNWAGFPPHKHDVDNMPQEGVLEEIYYFLFQPEQGFAIQKLYTKDGEIDETYTVKQDDLVEFPKGYHTTVGAPGYNTYFLWLMAGEHQGFFRSNDPDHDWVTAVENMVKKSR